MILTRKTPLQRYCKNYKTILDEYCDAKKGIYTLKLKKIEFPTDQYESALAYLKIKIEQKSIPGFKNQEKATLIIKKGIVSFEQAKNTAKSKQIESLEWNEEKQEVLTTSKYGISFLIEYAEGLWSGLQKEQALYFALVGGLKSGFLEFGKGVFESFSIPEKKSVDFSDFATENANMKIETFLQKTVSKRVLSKAAGFVAETTTITSVSKNSVLKLLNSNTLTATIATAAIAVPDVYKVLIKNTISWKQFSKNLAVNMSGTIGSLIGTSTGAIIGLSIGQLPTSIKTGVWCTIFGIIGGITGGILTAIATKHFADKFADDDVEEMLKITQDELSSLSWKYLLSKEEFENEIAPSIKKIITKKWLQSLYKKGKKNDTERILFLRHTFRPFFEKAVKKRTFICLPEKKLILQEVQKIAKSIIQSYKDKK